MSVSSNVISFNQEKENEQRWQYEEKIGICPAKDRHRAHNAQKTGDPTPHAARNRHIHRVNVFAESVYNATGRCRVKKLHRRAHDSGEDILMKLATRGDDTLQLDDRFAERNERDRGANHAINAKIERSAVTFRRLEKFGMRVRGSIAAIFRLASRLRI